MKRKKSSTESNGRDPLNLRPFQVGNGVVQREDGNITLWKQTSTSSVYSNAQIDDYQTLKRRDFLWQPPLLMRITARFSHPAATQGTLPSLSGTAGFGFWNDPFMMTGMRMPTLPRALWFFYCSSDSDIQLAHNVPGWGWKAAVIDCLRPFFLALLPTAPVGVLLMRSRLLREYLWPIAQRSMHVQEQLLTQPMNEWHQYELVWCRDRVRFLIDSEPVFETDVAPRGPLGLVIWLDNQSMIVSPTGQIRSGLVSSDSVEVMEVRRLSVGQLDA